MASKYVQTTLPMKQYKKLRMISVHRGTPAVDLIRDILTEWLDNQPNFITKEDLQHGSKET